MPRQNEINQRDNDEIMELDLVNQRRNQRENENINDQPVPTTNISEQERRILQTFRHKMNDIRYNICSECNERIPLMTLINNKMCRQCHKEKKNPKKFSSENNMDPGEVPEVIKGLTEIEEMLIAQVFTVITVYRLKGRQNGYRGNIINFPQDVRTFTTQLPRDPSTLNVLLVRRQSANDSNKFRDFTVHDIHVIPAPISINPSVSLLLTYILQLTVFMFDEIIFNSSYHSSLSGVSSIFIQFFVS